MTEKVIVPSDVTLEVIEGVDEGTVFTIDNKTITIGREGTCNLKLADEHVSKKHAQVVFRGGHFTAIDLGSLNKTMVNDNVYVQKNLANGDIITIGKTKIKFVWEGQTEVEEDTQEEPSDIDESEIPVDEDL